MRRESSGAELFPGGKFFPEWATSERVRASSRGKYKVVGAGISDEGYSAVRLQGLALGQSSGGKKPVSYTSVLDDEAVVWGVWTAKSDVA